MTKDPWGLDACIERGSLPTGEPIEAKFGPGWWSEEPDVEQEEDQQEPQDGMCHICHDETDNKCSVCGLFVCKEHSFLTLDGRICQICYHLKDF